MSTFEVKVVKIPKFGKHPNADTLSITQVFKQNVIFRTQDFNVGDLAVYVPYDACVPVDNPLFSFLGKDGKYFRVKPVRLRGIYSEGILVKAPEGMNEGDEVAEKLGIVKYVDPSELVMNSEAEKDPGILPVYEVEHYLKNSDYLNPCDEIVITEKLHGVNSRFVYHEGKLYAGSHHMFRKFNESNVWWKVAIKNNLEEKLKQLPGIAIYGEVYGKVQDLTYSVDSQEQVKFAMFDAYDAVNRKWFDFDDMVKLADNLGLPTVPVLYRGIINEEVLKMRSGKSTIDGVTLREGIVIRPVKEQTSVIGRLVLKYVSEEYKLRKNGTEKK